jgi:hypothetical protein
MIEIRWVDVGGGNLQLQQRTRLPRVDGNGAFCDFTPWSNWSAVPIVHGDHSVPNYGNIVSERPVKEIRVATDRLYHVMDDLYESYEKGDVRFVVNGVSLVPRVVGRGGDNFPCEI